MKKETLGKHIKTFREIRGYSVEQLAKKVGVTRAYIYQIELDISMSISISNELSLDIIKVLYLYYSSKDNGIYVPFNEASDSEKELVRIIASKIGTMSKTVVKKLLNTI
jgi:transcriptional regulator with XRE-family HTH domain